jgi:hypothetical protein
VETRLIWQIEHGQGASAAMERAVAHHRRRLGERGLQRWVRYVVVAEW